MNKLFYNFCFSTPYTHVKGITPMPLSQVWDKSIILKNNLLLKALSSFYFTFASSLMMHNIIQTNYYYYYLSMWRRVTSFSSAYIQEGYETLHPPTCKEYGVTFKLTRRLCLITNLRALIMGNTLWGKWGVLQLGLQIAFFICNYHLQLSVKIWC
jgi:hypothetical protein